MPVGGPPATPPAQRPARRSNAGLFLGAAALIVLIMLGTAAVRLLTLDRVTAPLAGESPSVTEGSPSAPEPTTAPVAPTASLSPEPTTPAPTTPAPPPAFTVTAQAHLCTAPSPNPLTVTATATVALAEAEVFYQFPPASPPQQWPMAVSGLTAQATFADWPYAPEVRWWVWARSTDGRTVTTPEEQTFMEPC